MQEVIRVENLTKSYKDVVAVDNINFAIENIMDTHYRPFSSGVSAAGRNFLMTFRTKF